MDLHRRSIDCYNRVMPARRTALAIVIAACGQAPPPPMHASSQASPLAADAVAGIADPRLRAIVADHWEFMMRWQPTWATTLGDHRYDDRLAPRDEASIAAMHGERDQLLARLDEVARDQDLLNPTDH